MTTTEIKSTVKISDTMQITRFQNGDSDRFVLQSKDEFEGTTATVKIFDKEDAIALAKELLLWANS